MVYSNVYFKLWIFERSIKWLKRYAGAVQERIPDTAAVGLTGSSLCLIGAQGRKSASTATARKPSAIGFTAARFTRKNGGKSQNFRHDLRE